MVTVPEGVVKSRPAAAVEPVPSPMVTVTSRPETAESTTWMESVPTLSGPLSAARANATVGGVSSSRMV
jgi:hypothetical protein